MTDETKSETKSEKAVRGAFGAENRTRLLDEYFAKCTDFDVKEAWKHAYKLLLWPDQTTGLAHCYESDKSQPGKNWYSRSLAFHDYVSTALGVKPAKLGSEIDWLFLRATDDLAREVLARAERLAAKAKKQRGPYETRGFPEPGEDPEVVSIVKEVLGKHLSSEPSPEKWRELVQRLRQYLAVENKRKNLVGEGFEDLLGQIIVRFAKLDPSVVRVRGVLQELPGFANARVGDKRNKVDLALTQTSMRTLVTAKWSLRADREKSFPSEFSEYLQARSDKKPFEYALLTNEFDPARLMRACENLAGNAWLFNHVVHINPDALKATYGSDPKEESMKKVLDYIESGRLSSLAAWLKVLRAR